MAVATTSAHDVRLAHHPTVMNDAKQEARQHQVQRRLGINAPGARCPGSTARPPHRTARTEDPIDTSQDVVIRD